MKKHIIIVEETKNGKRKALDIEFLFVNFSNIKTILTFDSPQDAYKFLKKTDITTDPGSKIIFKEVTY